VDREIKLSGSEISLLKTIGLSGAAVPGHLLLDRGRELEPAEFLDTLDGLITMGYVLSSKTNVRTMEDVERGSFRVNPVMTSELRDALSPGRRRTREQQRERRQRRG
jgi:hypothetical protein